MTDQEILESIENAERKLEVETLKGPGGIVKFSTCGNDFSMEWVIKGEKDSLIIRAKNWILTIEFIINEVGYTKNPLEPDEIINRLTISGDPISFKNDMLLFKML